MIPGVTQGRRCGVANLAHARQQPWLASISQQAVKRSGQRDRRRRIARALHRVEQRKQVGQLQQRQRCRDCGVLAPLLVEEPDVSAHRLDPARRQRRVLGSGHLPAQTGAERRIEREVVKAVRRCQPGGDQLVRQRGHVGFFPIHHRAEHVQIDPTVKHRQHPRPVAVGGRQPAQRQLDAGKQRLLPAAGEALRHRRHQSHQRDAGGVHAPLAQFGRQQGQRTGMAVHGIDQRLDGLDGLAPGIGRSARPGACAGVRIQRTLDQFHRVISVQPVQFTPMAGGIEGRGQRLAAGEDEAAVAHLQQARTQRQDGRQLAAGLVRQRLGRVRLQVGRQQDALHVVDHQQRGLLAQRTLDLLGRVCQVAGGREIGVHQLFAQRVEHRALVAVALDRNKRGAAHLLRTHHPARQLGRQGGLAFAALAPQHGITPAAQQPFERQQLAAAADEAGGGCCGQVAHAVG